jgi:hypothetical protein
LSAYTGIIDSIAKKYQPQGASGVHIGADGSYRTSSIAESLALQNKISSL